MTDSSEDRLRDIAASIGAAVARRHVFLCCDQTTPKCCEKERGLAAWAFLKQRLKELGLSGPGKVRINKAGCLDRCEEGPVVVVYPQGTWYTFVDNSDIDEIIETHLKQGKRVERLMLATEQEELRPDQVAIAAE